MSLPKFAFMTVASVAGAAIIFDKLGWRVPGIRR